MTPEQTLQVGMPFCIERAHLQQLLQALQAGGYQVIGPTLRDGAIVYDQLDSVDALPVGWTERLAPATYRLERRADEALFGYLVGPHSWKRFLLPPTLRLWQARRSQEGLQFQAEQEAAPRYALLGVRPCDLQAITLQDRIFLDGAYVDPTYRERRQDLFIVAVDCTEPGATCFCASMGTGPTAGPGYDLALTEIVESDRHYFVAVAGSKRGLQIAQQLTTSAAGAAEQSAVAQRRSAAVTQMGRMLETKDLPTLLQRHRQHPHWAEVGSRCLACGNCTLVCPTCFCTTVEDRTDLYGECAERWRQWDSCFTLDFSYIHGGSVRSSTEARYRHWLTHKLSGWVEQFGSLGCVGCGRCITWCPVGIDITAEVEALRRSERSEESAEASSARVAAG